MQNVSNILSSTEVDETPKSNRLIFDWVSFSSRIHDPIELMDLIGMRDVPWEILNASNGYSFRHYFGGISICFCEGSMDHVKGFYLLEMSGQGCRTFETYGNGDYDALFSLVQRESGKDRIYQDVRLTRLDVAFDDMTGLLDIDHICDKTRCEEFVSRFRNYEAIYGSKGNSVNFGSKGGDVFIRIYDKARERGYDDGRHWIRCELQLRKESASGFVFGLVQRSISDCYCGVLKNYLSFREVNEDDSNKRRWDESEWWTSFINNAQAISLYEKPGVIYNLSALEKYVMTQPAGSIQTLLTIYGDEAFCNMIRGLPKPKNPKYKRVISEFEQDLLHRQEIAGVRSIELKSCDEFEKYVDYVDELKHELNAINLDAKEKNNEKFNQRARKSAYDRLVEQGVIKTYTEQAIERGIMIPGIDRRK